MVDLYPVNYRLNLLRVHVILNFHWVHLYTTCNLILLYCDLINQKIKKMERNMYLYTCVCTGYVYCIQHYLFMKNPKNLPLCQQIILVC